jgi:hypothetical protein
MVILSPWLSGVLVCEGLITLIYGVNNRAVRELTSQDLDLFRVEMLTLVMQTGADRVLWVEIIALIV